MNTKEKVLQILQRSCGNYLSGNELSNMLKITRAAVWKSVNALREEGYHIDAVTNRGYCLAEPEGGFLNEEILQEHLAGNTISKDIILLNKIDSTNSYAKQIAEQSNNQATIVVAEEQTNGKGRMYRHFYSPMQDGVYFSVILYPDIHIDELNLLTLTAALSVVNAIELLTKIRPQIKWPNDVLWNGKKLCGILTETSVETETGRIQYSISGIGINVNNHDFPPDLKDTAGSLYQMSGKIFSRVEVISTVLKEMEKLIKNNWYSTHRDEMLEQYRKDISLIGKEIDLIYPNKQRQGKVLAVDKKGGLIISNEKQEKVTIYSGEISVRESKKDSAF